MTLWLIPLLPLAGAAINGLFGRRFSRKLVATIALAFTAASFLWALVIASRFLSGGQVPIADHVATWLQIGDFRIEYGFLVDQLSMVMMLVVTGVGFLIHIYSVAYMEHEGGYYRYFSYLNLFMFFMLTLVLANNYLLMFVGWEGVGLASYLLIGFFFRRDSAANAGKKAFITNRIGDFGFLIALFLLVKNFGTLQFADLFDKVAKYSPGAEVGVGLLTAIALLMLMGATGKSAQIPLYVWLPDAMEGPTPVSALIHAATMVTAGVYMICRSNAIFSRAPIALTVVAIIGTLTAFFAATIGITQTDIKRVLAYSTVSQLGYMFMAAGVAAYSAAIFHLMTHAFFKGLLFLGAGSVIHGVGGEQDMRKMGGLKKYMPWTFWTMFAATCAISGIPFFAGFYSKDEILWQAFSSPHGSWIFWLVGVITAFMTSFYMFRLLFMTFTGEYRGTIEPAHAGHGSHDDHGHHGTPHESPWMMLGPLVILGILSVVGGYVGVGHRFENFLAPVTPSVLSEPQAAATAGAETAALPAQQSEPASENSGLEDELMAISILCAFSGLGLAWFLYVKRRDLPDKIADSLGGLYTTVLNKYYVDQIYGAAIIRPLINGSRAILWRGIDAGAIDGTLNASAKGAQETGGAFRRLQSGNIRSYAGWVAAGAAVVVIYMVWMGTR